MTSQPQSLQLDASAISTAISQACYNDRSELQKLWQTVLRRQKEGLPADKKVKQLQQRLKQSEQRLEARKLAVPESIHFDDQLPISAKREEIAALIRDNQVVVIAGETGSGKTTQIPKICIQLGRGVLGMIGHTQPRRIAARTVASRIAEELKTELGGSVGYQVRFTDHCSDSTNIKLMTDGILLAETQQDPLLLKYDTLIIDEAHERSLNIDFLLGYLKGLLDKRPELKVIVTSATIDLEKFSKHFNDAPIIEVSGRTYPVETRYRPWEDEYEDVTEAIVGAVDEIVKTTRKQGGDILVFLSGEREIRETSHALKKAGLAQLEILPLYARLSLAEQNKVFQTHPGRRVVLATNVAETSLTVPGIRYVIDPGRARISRYSVRTKVQRLPIEAISQASANQRQGRCGRVAEGICYRLYSEEDFIGRPAFTDPEIQRTNLAAVILQMLQLRIGDVRRFSFVDKPESRLINDGFKLLEELQAVDKKGSVTAFGRQLHGLPVDPRFARVILAAAAQGCLREILIIVSGLSIQDPRERPAEKRQAADEKHRRFWDEDSDFIAWVNLWNYLEEQRQALSQNQFRKHCKKEYISYLRVREWRDLHHQLRISIKKLGMSENATPSNYEQIHRALITGLLSNLGVKKDDAASKGKDTRGEKNRGNRPVYEYEGTRNRRFHIFPGSSQFKKRPKWLMGAEFIETSQLFAHMVAKIDANWALDSATHLVKHHYFEPFYDAAGGQVMAFDRISLFGLNLVEKKRVVYSHIDKAEARQIFIREALVEGKYAKHRSLRRMLENQGRKWSERAKDGLESTINDAEKNHFFIYNAWLVEQVQILEAKARRKDILVDDQVLYDFYNEIVPENITNLAGFEHWRKAAELKKPELLQLKREQLMLHSAEDITGHQFPDQLDFDGLSLPLRYHFEPGHPDDGVSVCVPVELLHVLPVGRLQWLVPGLLREKCIAMVKALPKQQRKKLVPVPQIVDRALARMKIGKQPLTEVLSDVLLHIADVKISPDDWRTENLDDFYRMNIQVVDEKGYVIDRGRDLAPLRERYRQQVRQTLSDVHHTIEQQSLSDWSFGCLPEEVQIPRSGVQVKGFPALIDRGETVDIQVIDNPLDARVATRSGVARLAMIQHTQTVKYLRKQLLKGKDLGLAVLNLGKRDQVVDDIIMAAVSQACFKGDLSKIRTEKQFRDCVDTGRTTLVDTAQQYAALLAELLPMAVEIRKAMKANKNALLLTFAFADINHQMDSLFCPGFLQETPWEWLQHFPRYLRAILARLEKAPQNPQRDKVHIASLESHWQRHQDLLKKLGRGRYTESECWQEYRWMIEELRVSLFAQTLKTIAPVSDKRINKLWQQVLETIG